MCKCKRGANDAISNFVVQRAPKLDFLPWNTAIRATAHRAFIDLLAESLMSLTQNFLDQIGVCLSVGQNALVYDRSHVDRHTRLRFETALTISTTKALTSVAFKNLEFTSRGVMK